MLLDPDNKYIQTINAHTPLAGKTILEIGCGNGRITQDLADFATRVVATDLNHTTLKQAQLRVTAQNVEFLLTPDGFPDLKEASFDVAIYTLSLHHIPTIRMIDHLEHVGRLLKKAGQIVVIEPGNRGSFLEVKKRFGAGSGDESAEKAAAIRAMKGLTGWTLNLTQQFDVEFLFSDADDFYTSKLPGYQNLPAKEQLDLANFLRDNTTDRGIILTSERHLNLLTRPLSQ